MKQSRRIFFLASLARPIDLNRSKAESCRVVSLASVPIIYTKPITASVFYANSDRASSSFSVRAAKHETMLSFNTSLSTLSWSSQAISSSPSLKSNLLLIMLVSLACSWSSWATFYMWRLPTVSRVAASSNSPTKSSLVASGGRRVTIWLRVHLSKWVEFVLSEKIEFPCCTQFPIIKAQATRYVSFGYLWRSDAIMYRVEECSGDSIISIALGKPFLVNAAMAFKHCARQSSETWLDRSLTMLKKVYRIVYVSIKKVLKVVERLQRH